MTERTEADPSDIGFSGKVCARLTIRIDRKSTQIPQWHGLARISTILRAHKSSEPGRWVVVPDAEMMLRQELLSYAHLENNWDGEGAKTPSSEAVNDALAFLSNRPTDIPLPYAEEGSDGDVGVYWDNGNPQVFAEVSFEGDGTCAYFAVQGAPGAVIQECGSEGFSVAHPWPEDLLRILRLLESA
ncbi:MAG: hypothetical protein OXE48_10225 [Gammaproteobacteria bacterium]|nr:hypothetical protein [Gammaproteobacteria bacterium]